MTAGSSCPEPLHPTQRLVRHTTLKRTRHLSLKATSAGRDIIALSVYPSDNQFVRFLVCRSVFPDEWRVTAQRSFDGQRPHAAAAGIGGKRT